MQRRGSLPDALLGRERGARLKKTPADEADREAIERLKREWKEGVFEGADYLVVVRCPRCLLYVGQHEVPFRRYLQATYQRYVAGGASPRTTREGVDVARVEFCARLMAAGLLLPQCCVVFYLTQPFPLPFSEGKVRYSSDDESTDEEDRADVEMETGEERKQRERCMRRVAIEVWKGVLGSWPRVDPRAVRRAELATQRDGDA